MAGGVIGLSGLSVLAMQCGLRAAEQSLLTDLC